MGRQQFALTCSFGILLWEICTGEVPKGPLDPIRSQRIHEKAPLEVAALIEECLAPNPGDRPKMREVHQRLMEL